MTWPSGCFTLRADSSASLDSTPNEPALAFSGKGKLLRKSLRGSLTSVSSASALGVGLEGCDWDDLDFDDSVASCGWEVSGWELGFGCAWEMIGLANGWLAWGRDDWLGWKLGRGFSCDEDVGRVGSLVRVDWLNWILYLAFSKVSQLVPKPINR